MSVSLRPVDPAGVPFLLELVNGPGVAPFLAAARSRTTEQISEEVERSRGGTDGVLVVEAEGGAGGDGHVRAGNRRYGLVAEDLEVDPR